MKRLVLSGLVALVALTTLACAASERAASSPIRLHAVRKLGGDETWSGAVRVAGTVYVPRGVTLTILPGTQVTMEWTDTDGDGAGDAALYVRGRVVAEGTPEAPIRFAPADDLAEPARWGEIKMEYSEGNRFRYVTFERADWPLHAHFSEVDVERCVLRGGNGGMRFRSGRISIRENAFVDNRIGIRFWYSEPTIVGNRFEGNDTGLFLRGGVVRLRLEDNSFESRRYNLALGEGQVASVEAAGNYWGTDDPAQIRAKFYDRTKEPRLGLVEFEPYLAHERKERGDG